MNSNGTLHPSKKRVGHCEYRWGANPAKEPRRIQEKVRQSLRDTVTKLASLMKVYDVDRVNLFFEEFMKEVFVDSLYIHSSREAHTQQIQITGYDYIVPEKVFYNDTEAQQVANRLFLNGRNGKNTSQWSALHKGVTDKQIPKHVMIAVGVNNYNLVGDAKDTRPRDGHMICAFKHMDTLYCFNPWGAAYKRRHTTLPDDLIWEKLRVLYKCTHSVVYTGYNFQKEDHTTGVCAGLGYNFGTHMYNYILSWLFIRVFDPYSSYKLTMKYDSVPDIVSVNRVFNFNSLVSPFMFHSVRFNHFVMDLFLSFNGVFGQSQFDVSRPSNSIMLIFKNLTQRTLPLTNNADRTTNTRRRKVATYDGNNTNKPLGQDNSNLVFNVIVRAMSNANTNNMQVNEYNNAKTKFITNMRNSKWNLNTNNDNVKTINARRDVVRFIKSNDKRLNHVNHNKIQKIVRQYWISGNINR
jgi:hypothetical protein